jgi:hypothetical protein
MAHYFMLRAAVRSKDGIPYCWNADVGRALRDVQQNKRDQYRRPAAQY